MVVIEYASSEILVSKVVINYQNLDRSLYDLRFTITTIRMSNAFTEAMFIILNRLSRVSVD